jgi:putative FmdB family regulatory protein
MPIYEYECRNCGQQFERMQQFSEAPERDCPECHHKEVQRLLGTPLVIYNSPGFYVTDNGGNGPDKGSKNGKGPYEATGENVKMPTGPTCKMCA